MWHLLQNLFVIYGSQSQFYSTSPDARREKSWLAIVTTKRVTFH